MIKTIRRTPKFKREYKRLVHRHGDIGEVDKCITAVVMLDHETLRRHRDHVLTGEWEGYRELHVQSDLLLVYKIESDILTLVLVRLASHDELF